MEALRAGAVVPVLVEQVVEDALLVTLCCGARSFTGILLDCNKKSGLFCLPPLSPPTQEDPPPPPSGPPWDPPPTPGPPWDPPPPAAATAPMLPLGPVAPEGDPLPAGQAPPYPPYFEGAPYPPPLWLRHTYRQWVPQPPPRGLKRSRRRRRPSTRPRPPGRLTPSTIRLRPRRVLCQNCQTTLGPDQPAHAPRRRPGPTAASPSPPARRHGHREGTAELGGGAGRGRPERGAARGRAGRGGRGEAVPRSPVIKISYSTPQGTGEVVEIPSRIHGSLQPFCPPRGPLEPAAPPTSIPKLKLTRPGLPPAVPPPPKIRLKPQRPGGGDNAVSVYKAELVGEPGLPTGEPLLGPPSPPAFFPGRASGPGSARVSSGSEEDAVEEEEEEEDRGDTHAARRFRGFGRGQAGRDDLAFLVNYHKRRADSSSLSVCSNDSLDESKSSSSEAASPAPCDFLPGDDLSVSSSSSSRDERKTVPPLTVRLHTQSVPRCVTEDGRTVSVGDVVWGKIHGFPWWPARILDINLGQKADGDPSWQEAKVSWFGSPTTSFLSVSKLSPFSEFFKLRFNRKKKGLYRKAIAEAAKAADHLSPEIRDLLTQFET
ncbi:PWWP domain-containing protein 2B [Tachyglossus aculeatus]|uniref:PWWP domain-containing protein 2B n=1 Tax=Tachyglossus aculeatus TaxID=9261 RepID=UPI0018F59BB9|nr:PWWP domain-containing protein 2B [Tachyglossus aculeatus]